MRKKTLLSATAVALLAMSFPVHSEWLEVIGCRQAFGQEEDPEITAEAKKHYKMGQDAYAEGKYEVAIKELKKAYLLKRIPAILVNIAMTYRKTKDFDMSLYFYKKYLTEAPADDKQRPSVDTAIVETEKERELANRPQQLEPAKPAVEMAKAEPVKPAGSQASR
jgi:tetratricopeptide (TPR) repeat protein